MKSLHQRKTLGVILSVLLLLSSTVEGRCSKDDSWGVGSVLAGIAAGGAAILAAPVVLPVLGFTSAGVAAGSLAAGVQSAVYGGAATGAFSVMQSAGAAGLGLAAKAAIGTTAGVVGSTVYKKVAEDEK